MTSFGKREEKDLGVTVLGPVPGDVTGFYHRMILSGLRLAPSTEVRFSLSETGLGPTIVAYDRSCTGYLFGADMFEAPESDLYGFLSRELPEGGNLWVAGHYTQPSGDEIRSGARFLMFQGRLMTSEDRVLIRPCGERHVLRSRTDIKFDNVVPFGHPEGMDP